MDAYNAKRLQKLMELKEAESASVLSERLNVATVAPESVPLRSRRPQVSGSRTPRADQSSKPATASSATSSRVWARRGPHRRSRQTGAPRAPGRLIAASARRSRHNHSSRSLLLASCFQGLTFAPTTAYRRHALSLSLSAGWRSLLMRPLVRLPPRRLRRGGCICGAASAQARDRLGGDGRPPATAVARLLPAAASRNLMPCAL